MLAFSVVLNSTNENPIMSLNPTPCSAIPERAAGASPACAADAIPARHGADLQRSRRAAAPLLWLIRPRRLAQPDEHHWQQLGHWLNAGDPLADEVVRFIRDNGHREGWRLLEQGLQNGAQAVSDYPALHAFLAHCEHEPEWLDRAALQRGIEVSARSGKTGMRVLRDFGLMAGYQASAINQTLIKTGALEKGAQRRVAETTKWWMDCTSAGGLNPGGEGFRTTLRVRVIHAMVRAVLSERSDWNSAYLGLPVNQLDMQVTYLAFSVMFLLGQRFLGVPVSAQEGADVMHLWRYIGWLMGVDEQLLCNTEQEGRIALYRNLLSQPMADATSKQLAQALMDEPLQRYYPHAQWLRSHWDRQVHLSIIRLFIGRHGMRELGLPTGVLPWYPLVFAPGNAAVQTLIRLLPGGKAWLTRRGRAAQQSMLTILFGEHTPDIIRVNG